MGWVTTPSAPSGAGWALLEDQVLALDANFIEFSSIDQTHDHLMLDYELRASHTGLSSAELAVGSGTLDTSAGAYRWFSFGAVAGSSTGDTHCVFCYARVPRAAETWGRAKGHYFINRYTAAEARYFWGNGVTFGAQGTDGQDWGMWTNTTDPIDILRVTSDVPPFIAGSRIRLWGYSE